MPIYRNISRYVSDMGQVIGEIHRVANVEARVAFVVANNVIGGEVLAVSAIVEELLNREASLLWR